MEGSTNTRAVLLFIGDELLIGQTENTNAGWMARKLVEWGIETIEMRTLMDDREVIKNAFEEAWKKGGLVISTGGLGPTNDDMTAEVLADFCGAEMEFNEEVFGWIKEYKEKQGQSVNSLHEKQAVLPTGLQYFRNKSGTAPAMLYEKEDKVIVALPGVPYEMKELLTDKIYPRLKEKLISDNLKTTTLLTAGIPESEIAGQLEEFESQLPQRLSIAYLPGLVRVRIRLSARADSESKAEKELQKYSKELQSILGDAVYGRGEETLEGVLGGLLKKNNLSLATAESCTGGYIAHLITSVAGSSDYYKGSVVAYSNEIKKGQLGVKESTLEEYGAVSEETVREMLAGVCNKFQTDLGIAVSGIAGPGGGSEEKPVGTVCVAVGSPDDYRLETFQLNQNRLLNIEKSSLLAINMLRLFLWGD